MFEIKIVFASKFVPVNSNLHTSHHLLVQSQQWKHQNSVWRLFKTNNKDTWIMQITSFWYFYSFTPGPSVSIFDVEQVNCLSGTRYWSDFCVLIKVFDKSLLREMRLLPIMSFWFFEKTLRKKTKTCLLSNFLHRNQISPWKTYPLKIPRI